jgi:hypothetical protein
LPRSGNRLKNSTGYGPTPRSGCGQGLGFHFPAEEFEDFWKQIVFSNSPWQGEPIASFRF